MIATSRRPFNYLILTFEDGSYVAFDYGLRSDRWDILSSPLDFNYILREKLSLPRIFQDDALWDSLSRSAGIPEGQLVCLTAQWRTFDKPNGIWLNAFYSTLGSDIEDEVKNQARSFISAKHGAGFPENFVLVAQSQPTPIWKFAQGRKPIGAFACTAFCSKTGEPDIVSKPVPFLNLDRRAAVANTEPQNIERHAQAPMLSMPSDWEMDEQL